MAMLVYRRVWLGGFIDSNHHSSYSSYGHQGGPIGPLGFTLAFTLHVPWSRLSLCRGWDGHPTLNDGILILGPYKPLRNWVDEFIPYYMEIPWELIDPIAHMFFQR